MQSVVSTPLRFDGATAQTRSNVHVQHDQVLTLLLTVFRRDFLLMSQTGSPRQSFPRCEAPRQNGSGIEVRRCLEVTTSRVNTVWQSVLAALH